jgi:hypothetical protein
MKSSSHWTSKRLVLGVGALILAVGSGAGAYAATASHAQSAAGRGEILGAAAGELGITAQQLRSDLASGQTLAQIATENASSPGGLEQAILSAARSRLDQAVASGKITNGQEQTLLAHAGTRLDKLVTVSHPIARLELSRLRAGLIRLSARYVGLSLQQLRSELRSGTTLAEIAADNGKTTTGLEQAMVSALTTRLDKGVAAGTITPAREQTLLSMLQQRLDALVDHTFVGSS